MKIDKNIPLPPHPRPRAPDVIAWDKLEPGDSVFVPAGTVSFSTLSNQRTRAQRELGRKFAMRKVEENGRYTGQRVWRLV